jgi:hypothetical protein
MRRRIKVMYPDGTSEIVKSTPRAKIACERHFKGVSESIAVEGSYWLAWYLLEKVGKTKATFDEWIDNEIEDCMSLDEDDEDIAEVDPTNGGTPTPDPSSSSASAPASRSKS